MSTAVFWMLWRRPAINMCLKSSLLAAIKVDLCIRSVAFVCLVNSELCAGFDHMFTYLYFYCVQISTTDSITHILSVTITCSWWRLWMPNTLDLSANFIKPAFSAKKKGSPSALKWYRTIRMRSCCQCSVARPRISLTISWTHWITLDKNMSAITLQDDNVSNFEVIVSRGLL